MGSFTALAGAGNSKLAMVTAAAAEGSLRLRGFAKSLREFCDTQMSSRLADTAL